jgi:hypothetical protein
MLSRDEKALTIKCVLRLAPGLGVSPSSLLATGLSSPKPHAALAGCGARRHARGMFVVTEADAAAIRAIFHQEGELSAAIELRRRFPGIADNTTARVCARSIAGWTPLSAQPCTVTRLRPRRDS